MIANGELSTDLTRRGSTVLRCHAYILSRGQHAGSRHYVRESVVTIEAASHASHRHPAVEGLSHAQGNDGEDAGSTHGESGTSRLLGRDVIISSTSQPLYVPRSKLNLGRHAFSVAASDIWNELPTTLKSCDLRLASFRKNLKTYRFKIALPP